MIVNSQNTCDLSDYNIRFASKTGFPIQIYIYKIKSMYGKDSQLSVNTGDFPELAKTGLHSQAELNKRDTITGIPISVINYIGRPGRFSGAGFMAEDEDIISVLQGDNELVKRLNLAHPQLANPLFHIWNSILEEYKHGNMRRFSDIQYFLYNGCQVNFKAESMKGWQASIFHDDVRGRFDIDIQRKLSSVEEAFLKDKYSHLSDQKMAVPEEELTSFHFSEMVPYYITRYGFYEGHTDYRADPITIAFVFGLKSIEQIENAFPGKLYHVMTSHFINE